MNSFVPRTSILTSVYNFEIHGANSDQISTDLCLIGCDAVYLCASLVGCLYKVVSSLGWGTTSESAAYKRTLEKMLYFSPFLVGGKCV